MDSIKSESSRFVDSNQHDNSEELDMSNQSYDSNQPQRIPLDEFPKKC